VALVLTRTTRLVDFDTFCRATGTHPALVRRLVALGLLEPEPDADGAWWFAPTQFADLARIKRLRAGLGLNYAAIGVVTDLLDRVAALERRLRQSPSRTIGDPPWT
jgi:chaperone modulatory protein CbpM